MDLDEASGPSFPGDLAHLPTVTLPLDKLITRGSPRSIGEDIEHIRTLAETEQPLPPILVHRPTMRVLDGIHRVRAVELRGEREIEARLFDGDEARSFVLAVHANIAHGLPLSLADRKAAATRIMDYYPQWSDRAIGAVTGLAHQTVAAIRKRPTGRVDQLDARLGRDGRLRPRDSAGSRDLASKMLAENPGASLREIARATHMSPETVRKVRAELTRNDGAVRQQDRDPDPGAGSAARGRPPKWQPSCVPAPLNEAPAWQALRADPAFRSTETGRSLLQMLSAYSALQQHGQQLIDNVPVHCISMVAAAARACAQAWHDFADRVEGHSQRCQHSSPASENPLA
jgi:hypothetical protein